jgi:cytochrome bd-type quinol oxidase subunit 2
MRRLILAAFFITIGLLLVVNFVPTIAFADAKSEICEGIQTASGEPCDTGSQLTNVIRNIINLFSIVVGVVAVIMIIIGGFRYVTAGGDSSNVSSAKNTIIYAVVGLIVVLLSQAIVRFVLEKT